MEVSISLSSVEPTVEISIIGLLWFCVLMVFGFLHERLLYAVYKPAVQNNTIIADTGIAHKLHSILPKFLPQTSLFSLSDSRNLEALLYD